jgi:hypothetical protein
MPSRGTGRARARDRTGRRHARGAPAGAALRRATLAALLATAAGCELQEITIADAEDVIVAEFTLVAGARLQTGILHRTQGTGMTSEPVLAARVVVTEEDGSEHTFEPRSDNLCFTGGDDAHDATCYLSASVLGPGSWVRAGQRYTLRIALPDGRVLTGVTSVPDSFGLLRPSAPVCALPPDQPLEIVWSRSPTAWVYAAETELQGIAAALEPRGVDAPRDPLRLFGLALSNRDTAIAFPAEFGVFDRFDPDLTQTLAAIQGGLPPGVEAEVVIAAADRNYVNWERGGAFNPSGFVRVPSVFGDGTGVFAAILPLTFFLTTADVPSLPSC